MPPGATWPTPCGTCPTPTHPAGSGGSPRRWCRCSGGSKRAAAAQDPPPFPLRAAAPDAVVDPVDQGILEALEPYAALHARPLGHFDGDPIGREELPRRAIPAGRIAQPVMITALVPNVGRGLVVPASDGVHRNKVGRAGRRRGSREELHGRRTHPRYRSFGAGTTAGSTHFSMGARRSCRPVSPGTRP